MSAYNDPAHGGFAVTPHDTTLFDATRVVRALYVGVGGTVVALTSADQVLTFLNVPSGSILPVRCKRVNSTSTTATNIIALE
jgi:hypothetical protein